MHDLAEPSRLCSPFISTQPPACHLQHNEAYKPVLIVTLLPLPLPNAVASHSHTMSEPKDIPDTSSAPASSSAPDSAITPRAQRRDLFTTLTALPSREGQPSANTSSVATVVGSASPAGRQHSTGEGSRVSRSSSLHGKKASEPGADQRRSSSGRRAGPSGAKSQASSPPSPHAILGGQKSGSRHLSMGAATTRPVAPLSTGQRTAFEEAVAASSLASTSSGLQALLRDHPELVSSELAKAAGENWSQLNESARGSRVPSGPSTPTGGARGTAAAESTAGSEAASEHGGWPEDGLTPDALRAQEGATPTASIPAQSLGGAGEYMHRCGENYLNRRRSKEGRGRCLQKFSLGPWAGAKPYHCQSGVCWACPPHICLGRACPALTGNAGRCGGGNRRAIPSRASVIFPRYPCPSLTCVWSETVADQSLILCSFYSPSIAHHGILLTPISVIIGTLFPHTPHTLPIPIFLDLLSLVEPSCRPPAIPFHDQLCRHSKPLGFYRR